MAARDRLIRCPSDAMQRVYDLAERLAPTHLNVLLSGEAGVGKEAVARLIHRHSTRAKAPFVRLFPGRDVGSGLERHLFRCESFSSGFQFRTEPGWEKGTLFISGVHRLDEAGQAQMLHLLLERETGESSAENAAFAEVRLLASTSVDLWLEVEAGRFRNDLYQRLKMVELSIPPLRERREDIPVLAAHFLETFGERFKSDDAIELPEEVLKELAGYSWPGNVAELSDFIRRVVVTRESPETAAYRLRQNALRDAASPHPLIEVARRASERIERRIITQVLEDAGWNRRIASERLNISYRALLEKIKRLSIG